LAHTTRQKIERRANTQESWGFKTTHVLGHPKLLLRRTQTHPDNVCTRRIDLVDDLGILGGSECPKGRRQGPGDL
jgi:hypothetical protein